MMHQYLRRKAGALYCGGSVLRGVSRYFPEPASDTAHLTSTQVQLLYRWPPASFPVVALLLLPAADPCFADEETTVQGTQYDLANGYVVLDRQMPQCLQELAGNADLKRDKVITPLGILPVRIAGFLPGFLA